MNKKIIQAVQIILMLSLAAFIFIQAGDFFETVDWMNVANNWAWMILAGLFFLLGYYVQSRHWQYVCQMIEPNVSKKQWMAFFASQPYKYLPTSLFTLSFRAKFSSQLGMGLRHSSQAQLIENLNLVGAALLLGAVLLAFTISFWIAVSLVIIAASFCFALWYKETIKLPKFSQKTNLRSWIKAFAISCLGWVVIGLGFFVIAFGIENRLDPILGVAANSLATGLGIVAIFAPGGIGVRELVFSYLGFLSGTIIVWRLITFTVDIVMGIISDLLIRKHR